MTCCSSYGTSVNGPEPFLLAACARGSFAPVVRPGRPRLNEDCRLCSRLVVKSSVSVSHSFTSLNGSSAFWRSVEGGRFFSGTGDNSVYLDISCDL